MIVCVYSVICGTCMVVCMHVNTHSHTMRYLNQRILKNSPSTSMHDVHRRAFVSCIDPAFVAQGEIINFVLPQHQDVGLNTTMCITQCRC